MSLFTKLKNIVNFSIKEGKDRIRVIVKIHSQYFVEPKLKNITID